jgi:hypothetical protein
MGMSTITGIFRVNADGNVLVPVGPELAGSDVKLRVNVDKVEADRTFDQLTDEEWRARVAATAGSITDPSFRRHDQGQYEDRLGFE